MAKDRRSLLVKRLSKKAESTLVQSKAWDAYTTPPKNTLKGTIVPKIVSRHRRRICVETHRFWNESDKSTDETGGSYETCFLLMMDPIKNFPLDPLKSFHKGTSDKDEGKESARPMESAPLDDMSAASDDGTLDGAFSGVDTMLVRTKTNYDGWSIKYQLPLRGVSIQKVKNNSVTFKVEHRDINHLRKIKFETDEEAKECASYIRELKSTEEARMAKKYQECMKRLGGEVSVNAKEHISLLIEIVGATDLPCGDLKSSDPYVKCYFDGVIVHKTGYLKKTLNPIFTLKQKNLFLLETTAESLFKSDGLHLYAMDYDGIGKDEPLGICSVRPDLMYVADGERLPLEVEIDKRVPKQEGADDPILVVRIRHATDNDMEFMGKFTESLKTPKKKYAKIPNPALLNKGGKHAIQSYITRNEKTEKLGIGAPIKKYRVRPCADPERPEETEWLSKSDLESEMMKESREWIYAGSGGQGRLFVEVLEANDLPNLDSGGFAGNKTDSFCCFVFEDCWLQTDIIDDCLCPKWMPWSKRAFLFNIAHPCSELFIGVFDYDKMDEHDLIGRVAIDIANLQPDTVYDLMYTLYPTGKTDTRDGQGKLRLRIRLEIDDERKFVMSALQPPSTIYVNVPSKKKYKVIDQVLNGNVDMESYSLKTFFMYIDELQSYQGVLPQLEEAIITVIFWRGHHSIKLFGSTYWLPIHSIFNFITCIIAVEYPQVIPSLFFLSIAWVMLATLWFRRHNPNHWNRCKPFKGMLSALIFRDGFTPAKVEPFENNEAIIAYEQQLGAKMKRAKKLAQEVEQDAKETAQENAELAQEVGASHDLSTKKSPGLLDVDMLRPYLEPYQTYLAIACRFLRYIGNIFVWQEPYLSFWVMIGSLALSVGCLFVPWFFLIRWTSRIIVWALFGPWMKIVDIYYWKPMESMNDEERLKKKLEAKRVRKIVLKRQIEEARIEREKAVKIKDMKTFLFGKYILKVPAVKGDRWWDVPLPDSSAVPYKAEKLALAELAMKEAGYHRTRVPGQHLEGEMIPTIKKDNFTEAPMGQPTKKHAESESDTAAYTKVGSLVAGAAIITYFGVPMLSSLGSNLFGA
mmetsp:Transcript_13765/g.20289  ORF Transcript_13765/g.20289 Transcript_13765/m.20289 type:complete len:1086 (+) Transcript_13765:65-3322(+)